MSGLTRRQYEALSFIRGFIAEKGYSPSYDEMASALGVSSRSGIHRVVHALRERGSIEFIDDRPRSISLTGGQP